MQKTSFGAPEHPAFARSSAPLMYPAITRSTSRGRVDFVSLFSMCAHSLHLGNSLHFHVRSTLSHSPCDRHEKERTDNAGMGDQSCCWMRYLRRPSCRDVGDPHRILLSTILARPVFCLGHHHRRSWRTMGSYTLHHRCDD